MSLSGLMRHFARVMEQLTSNTPRPNMSNDLTKRLFNHISTWAQWYRGSIDTGKKGATFAGALQEQRVQ
jgi:hypothetical protein